MENGEWRMENGKWKMVGVTVSGAAASKHKTAISERTQNKKNNSNGRR